MNISNADLREISLASEYGAPLPLWDDSGLLAEPGLLSEDLEAELVKWADVFQVHYDSETGWPDRDICVAQYREGLRLQKRLQEHFGPEVVVQFDYWELNVRGVELRLSDVQE